jgi:peptidoglycan hydrolase CwlO-like protein
VKITYLNYLKNVDLECWYNEVMKFSIKKTIVVFVLILTSYFLHLASSALASNCPSSDYDCQITEIQREIDALRPAQEYNKKELADLRSQIANLEKRILSIDTELKNKDKDIQQREEDLAYTQSIFEEKTKSHYKFLRIYVPILPFLSASDATSAFREIVFGKRIASSDIDTMDKYVQDLVSLKNDKENLEKSHANLTAVKAQVKGRTDFLAGEVAKTENYLTSLSSKQQELITMKSGGFSTSVGETPATLEPCSGPQGSANFCDPGFRPAFAAFSFGAPHRTGMSQYGAFGRSKSGQSAETILSAYFQGAELRKDYPSPSTIGVKGYGRVSLEENYLLGIYEVPEKWGNEGGFEALKAQAVAARSFALAYTNNGTGTICTTEACQVYKPQLKSGKWAEAVRATRGWVLVKGGVPAKAYYASTAGGFTISQWGWNGIKDANGDWPNGSYEKVSASPWFYKGWYKMRSGASCGRSNPWLNESEMADILNAWQVITRGGGDVSRVTPISNCWSGNPYSVSELSSIGGFASVSSVSVVYSNSGATQTIAFGTNKGSVSITGEEFKKAFNLRAPGYIGLKSSLFNVEKL